MKIWRRVVAGALAAIMTVAFVPASAFATTAKTDLPFAFENTDYGLMGADGVTAKKLTITNPDHASFVTPEADSVAQGYSLVKEDKSRDGYYHLYLIGAAGVAHEFQNTDESVIDGINLTRAAYYWEDRDEIGDINHLKNYETGLVNNLLEVYNPATEDYGIFNADTGAYYDYDVDDVNWGHSDGKSFAIAVEKDGLYGLIKGDGSWLARPHYSSLSYDHLEDGFVVGYDSDADINKLAIITLDGNTVSKDGSTVSCCCSSIDKVAGDFLLVDRLVQLDSNSRTSIYDVMSISSGTVLKSFTYDELEENWGGYAAAAGENSLCLSGWVFNEKYPAGVDLATKYRVANPYAGSDDYGYYDCGLYHNSAGGYMVIAEYWDKATGNTYFNIYTFNESLKLVNTDTGVNEDDCYGTTAGYEGDPRMLCNGCSDGYLYYGTYHDDDSLYYGTYCDSAKYIKQVKSTTSAVCFGGSNSDVIFTPVGNDYFIASPDTPKSGSSWSTNPCYVVNGQNGQQMADTVGCSAIYRSYSVVNPVSNQETYELNGFLVLQKESTNGDSCKYALFNTANGKVSEFYDSEPNVVCVTDKEAGEAFIEVGNTYLDGDFKEIPELNGYSNVFIDPANNTVSAGYFTIYSYDPSTLALTKVTSFNCWTYGWREVAAYDLGVAKIYPAENEENESIDLVNSKGEGIYQGESDILYDKQVFLDRGMAIYYASSSVCDDPSVKLIDDNGTTLVSGDFAQSKRKDGYDYVRFYGDLCLMFPDVGDANVLYIYDVSERHDETVSVSKVTEKDLYTTSEYSKYLINKGYDTACQRVVGAEGGQLYTQGELATILAAFKSNASDLTGTYEKILKDHVMGKDEDGYTYSELELYESLAQEAVENMQSFDTTAAEDLYSDIKSVYKTAKKIKKTSKYMLLDGDGKAGTRSILVQVIKTLTYSGKSKTSVLGPLQIVTDDELCKEFFDWADSRTDAWDETINAVDLLLDYAVLWRLDMDTVQALMKNVPKNSGLYKGLSRMEYKLNHPSLAFVEGVLDTLVGDAVDMFKEAGKSFLEYACEIGSGTFYLADLSWKLAAKLMPGPDIDASNEAWLSFNNAMTMYNAMQEYRSQIVEDTQNGVQVDYSARKKALKRLVNAVNAFFGVAAEKITARDEDSGNDDAQRTYDAYANMMSYSSYIHSCLANAGAAWTYSVSGGRATITGYTPGLSVKSSWDSYLLEVPSTVTDEAGNVYPVASVSTGSFGEDSGVGTVVSPAGVEVASGAITGGTDEQVIAADKQVANDGLQVTKTGSVSFDDEGTLSVSGYEVQVTYEDGSTETVEAVAAHVVDATHIALVAAGAEVVIEASGVKAPAVVHYEDENGYTIAADELGSSSYGTAPEAGAVNAPDGYDVSDQGEWTMENGTWVRTVVCAPKTRNIAMADVSEIEDVAYTGEAITPEPSVTFGDETLVKDRDYTLEYADNVEGVDTQYFSEDGKVSSVSYATVIITGMGAYTGSQKVTFAITKDEDEDSWGDGGIYGKYDKIMKGTAGMGSFAFDVSEGEEVVYTFKPSVTATYRFYTTGGGDTFGLLYDSNMEWFDFADSGGTGENFLLSAKLQAGKTYYIGVRNYFGGADSGMLHIEKVNTSAAPNSKKIGGVTYKVSGGVVVVSAAAKTLTKAIIPAAVKIGSKSYKVTSIKGGAFSGCKKLATVTIGSNVTSVGGKAFFGCKKLKKLVIKAKKLKAVGSKAFKGNKSKCKVTYPSGKKAAYKKMLKKAGLKM